MYALKKIDMAKQKSEAMVHLVFPEKGRSHKLEVPGHTKLLSHSQNDK